MAEMTVFVVVDSSLRRLAVTSEMARMRCVIHAKQSISGVTFLLMRTVCVASQRVNLTGDAERMVVGNTAVSVAFPLY